jgi:multisubunit Na+/H+ antiporter MnhE subunit
VKEFAVYTGLRVLMFAATFGIVFGVWLLVAGKANVFVALVVGFVVSGLGSYFLLNRQREALAQRVETRAARATQAFEQMRAREDAAAEEKR